MLLFVIFAANNLSCNNWLSRDEAIAATITLPETGQTGCWNGSNTPIGCVGTGQDGDKLAGASWPSPRFVDNNNGTVTDNLTGLIWLENANCTATVGGIAKEGKLVWADALTWSNNLKNGDCGLSDASLAGDWRLPNRKELLSLVDRHKAAPSLPAGHPFLGVQFVWTDLYWTSSSLARNPRHAFIVGLLSGKADYDVKTNSYYVWPVRDNSVGLTVQNIVNGTLTSGIGGTVTSSPAGISCANNTKGTTVTCSSTFSSMVTLYATPAMTARFAGWNGDCRGTGACSITMNAAKAVTATFNQAPLILVSGVEYSTLPLAYQAVADGSEIQLQLGIDTDALTADRAVSVTLKGGFNATYSATSGNTTLTAPLIIKHGTVVANGIQIR